MKFTLYKTEKLRWVDPLYYYKRLEGNESVFSTIFALVLALVSACYALHNSIVDVETDYQLVMLSFLFLVGAYFKNIF